jgi:hypothetical protein
MIAASFCIFCEDDGRFLLELPPRLNNDHSTSLKPTAQFDIVVGGGF